MDFADVEDDIREDRFVAYSVDTLFIYRFCRLCFYGTPPVRAMNLEEGYSVGSTDGRRCWMQLRTRMRWLYTPGSERPVYGRREYPGRPIIGQKERKDRSLRKVNVLIFITGKFASEGEVITVIPADRHIPAYAEKTVSLLSLWPAMSKFRDRKYPLEVRHYGNKPGTYSLYDDDGSSYNYEKESLPASIGDSLRLIRKERKKGKSSNT